MVTTTSNLGSRSQQKKCFEKMANGLLAVNISGSPAVGARWKAEKKYTLLPRSLPYTICYLFKRVPILANFSEFGKIVNNSIR